MPKKRVTEMQIEDAEAGNQPLSKAETIARERNAPFRDAEYKSVAVEAAQKKALEERTPKKAPSDNPMSPDYVPFSKRKKK